MQNELIIKEVNTETRKDIETLFEDKGGPKSCWCMVWRANSEEAKYTDGKSRKAFLKARVDAGIPVGILAYKNNKPVAWCSVAPKLNDKDERIWSIVCFYIKKEFRGSKLFHLMIEAAIDYAQRNNATIIEAYPVDHDSPSYRFMGYVPTFQQYNFEDVGKAGTRRHVMRLRSDGIITEIP